MKKLFLMFSFCISLLFASNNSTISQDNIQISYITKEDLKNNIEKPKKSKIYINKGFLEKNEFTTFCTKYNLNSNPFRKYLNIYVNWLKSLSIKNIFLAIIVIILYPFPFLIIAFVIKYLFSLIGIINEKNSKSIGEFINSLVVILIIPASDLYFNNPLAIVGFYMDWLITWFKLLHVASQHIDLLVGV
jgi:hypothetical protein